MKKITQQYKILVIEDNDGDFLLVNDFLDDVIQQPLVIQATSFREAKNLLERDSCAYDVILLDLSLPDSSGKKLIFDLQDLCHDIPIIVLTGYSDLSFGVQSLSLGVSDYLIKEELTSWTLYKSIIYSIERKIINNQLIESEKKYRDLFQLSPQPMWVLELNSLQFLDVNQAAIRQYGYNKEEFLSMSFREIHTGEEPFLLQQNLNGAAMREEIPLKGIFQLRTKTEDVLKVDIESSLISFKGQKAAIVLASDVTERQNYISAIENQNQKLQEISWIQSHVVRAPLARLMGLVFLLQDIKYHPPQEPHLLDYILRSAEELDTIIRDITLKAERISLNEKNSQDSDEPKPITTK